MGVVLKTPFENKESMNKMFAFLEKHYIPLGETLEEAFNRKILDYKVEDAIDGPYQDEKENVIRFKFCGALDFRFVWDVCSWMAFVYGKTHENGSKYIIHEEESEIIFLNSDKKLNIQTDDRGIVIHKKPDPPLRPMYTDNETEIILNDIRRLSDLWAIENEI